MTTTVTYAQYGWYTWPNACTRRLAAVVRPGELVRAGIELDSLRWQPDHHRKVIATLIAKLDAARAELRKLRRSSARSSRMPMASDLDTLRAGLAPFW